MTKTEPKKKREISVVERRLKSGSIFAISAGEIPLKDAGRWSLREVNSELRMGRLREMTADKRWQFAEASDLAVDPYDVGYRVQDGKLVKGPRGELVLMKMEAQDFREVQIVKDKENRANTYVGSKSLKETIVQGASRQDPTGRAADYLDRNLTGVTVTDSTERIPLDD